jgi:hypothetical protein
MGFPDGLTTSGESHIRDAHSLRGWIHLQKKGHQASLTGNSSPPVVILQVTLEFVRFFLLGLENFLLLCH